jgi:hypothetical protein
LRDKKQRLALALFVRRDPCWPGQDPGGALYPLGFW